MRKNKRFNTQPSQSTGIHQSVLSAKGIKQSELKIKKGIFWKQSSNFYKKPSNITLPIEAEEQQTPLPVIKVSKKNRNPERLVPPRNNLRCLNDFLKQQALFIKNKERIVSNLSRKQISNISLDALREKVLGLINQQKNQSQIINQESCVIQNFNDVHIKNIQLECEQIKHNVRREKHHKIKANSMIGKHSKSVVSKKQRLVSLTPLLKSPEVSNKGSSQKIMKPYEDTSITNTELSKIKNSSVFDKQSKFSWSIVDLSFK